MRGFEFVRQIHRVNYELQTIAAGEYHSDFEGETIKIKEFSTHELPSRATFQSAGYDFQSPCTFTLSIGQSKTIWTDVRCKMLPDEFLSLHVRSSLGKKGLQLKNQVGIIDSDYYNNPTTGGNIGVMLTNVGDTPITINAKDYFVQGIFQKYLTTANDIPRTTKRTGGFGSTT